MSTRSDRVDRPSASTGRVRRRPLPGLCARQAGLLDHYDRVQGEEARLRQASAYARAAHRYALWALGSSGAGVLLATLALLTR